MIVSELISQAFTESFGAPTQEDTNNKATANFTIIEIADYLRAKYNIHPGISDFGLQYMLRDIFIENRIFPGLQDFGQGLKVVYKLKIK